MARASGVAFADRGWSVPGTRVFASWLYLYLVDGDADSTLADAAAKDARAQTSHSGGSGGVGGGVRASASTEAMAAANMHTNGELYQQLHRLDTTLGDDLAMDELAVLDLFTFLSGGDVDGKGADGRKKGVGDDELLFPMPDDDEIDAIHTLYDVYHWLHTHLQAALRQRGNVLFKRRAYNRAAQLYSRALSLADGDKSGSTEPRHVLLGNRCACYLRIAGRATDAYADARICTQTAPTWGKGWFRLASACQQLHKYDQARDALTRCLLCANVSASDVEKQRGLLDAAEAEHRESERQQVSHDEGNTFGLTRVHWTEKNRRPEDMQWIEHGLASANRDGREGNGNGNGGGTGTVAAAAAAAAVAGGGGGGDGERDDAGGATSASILGHFLWRQTAGHVYVCVPLVGVRSRDIDVIMKPRQLRVAIRSTREVLVDGELCHPTKASDGTWTMDGGSLVIALPKSNLHLYAGGGAHPDLTRCFWNRLFAGDPPMRPTSRLERDYSDLDADIVRRERLRLRGSTGSGGAGAGNRQPSPQTGS